MDVNEIRKHLTEFQDVNVERYISYIWKELHAGKNGQDKNPWMKQRPDMFFVDCFKTVALSGLAIDGVHITIQKTGISFDYQAYKNKMLLAYPDSLIDVDLVYEGDEYYFSKESGEVAYSHKINNPFTREDGAVIGGYCVVKNKRGEFLTILTRPDIDKHRKVAKTDYIWSAWFVEMARKTLIKKACKQHFEDIFQDMNTSDNENSDIDNSLEVDLEVKAVVEEITTAEKLKEYWEANTSKHPGKWFNQLVSQHKEHLAKVAEDEAGEE
jgi:hypothetical protein